MKDRLIAYTMLVGLIIVLACGAVWTACTMVILFPFWLLGDRTIYSPIFGMFFPE